MCTQCEKEAREIAGAGIYSACKVGNAIDIYRWSKATLGDKLEAPEDLHCTVAYSKAGVDLARLPDFKAIKLGRNEHRRIGRLGDMIVLYLEEQEARPLKKIWKAFIDQGASFEFSSYIAHISLAKSSDLSDRELAGLVAYSGPILLLPPYIDELRDETATVEVAAQLLSKTAKNAKIKEIKALIVKFENAKSDRVADKLKTQIYEELDDYGILREEVGLKPLKAKKVKEPAGLPKLTDNEKKMLVSVFNCHYGNNGDEIWAWAHNDSRKPHNLAKVTASGVIASLVKKKLMHSFNDGKDSTCGLTPKGQEVAGKLDKVSTEPNAPKPAPTPKIKKVKEPTKGIDTRASMVIEIKTWIERYERTSSEAVAERLRKQIHAAMEEYGIQREEVGLPPVKTKAPKKSVAKLSPEAPKSTMPLRNLPATRFTDAAKGNNTVKIRYMKELWVILNQEKFGGQMKIPNLELSKKVKVEKFRRRGVWFQSTRRLAINPHLFNNEAAFYEVMLHEMCHQAVSEITKLGYRETQRGHGPVWASWMVKVGLDPKRFDANSNFEYMSDDDKELFLKKEEIKKEAIAKEVQISPAIGKPAKWFDKTKGVWHGGLIGVPNDQAGKRWMFVEAGHPSGRWTAVPANWFYSVDEATANMLKKNLTSKLDDCIAMHRSNKEIRANNRAYKKELRNMWSY